MKTSLNKILTDFTDYGNLVVEGGIVSSSELEEMLTIFHSGKGIVLLGKTGRGKSFPFEILWRIIHPKDELKFRKASCIDIVNNYNINGPEILKDYLAGNYLFDDLGTEENGMHYGNRINVMDQLIQLRYQGFYQGFKTYFTTNLDATRIEERYGERSFSRLKEMCKWLPFDGEDKRALKNFKGWVPVNHEVIITADEQEWYDAYQARRNRMKNLSDEERENLRIEDEKERTERRRAAMGLDFFKNPDFQKFKEELKSKESEVQPSIEEDQKLKSSE